MKLRLSYYRAIARGNIGDLRASASAVDAQNILTVSGGNPDLEPRLADNIDASLEYYFDDGQSLVSLALFRKVIQDEIFFQTSQITGPGGQTVITSTPQNAGDAVINGIEFNLVKNSFEFLPEPFDGLGFSGNLTFLDAESDLVAANGAITEVDFVFEQPEVTANVSVFYQYGPLEAKASYNYTGSYFADFAGNPRFDDKVGTYDTLDLQARYTVNDNLTLIGEVRNVFEEERTKFTGPGQTVLEDLSLYGKSWFIGGSYKF